MAEPSQTDPSVELFVVTQLLAAWLRGETEARRSQFIVDLMRQTLDFRESIPETAGRDEAKLQAVALLDQIASDLVRAAGS